MQPRDGERLSSVLGCTNHAGALPNILASPAPTAFDIGRSKRPYCGAAPGSDGEANKDETAALARLSGGPANQEAVKVFREKREPNFAFLNGPS